MTGERDPYVALGVRRVINAATTLTALGGTVLAAEVVCLHGNHDSSFTIYRCGDRD